MSYKNDEKYSGSGRYESVGNRGRKALTGKCDVRLTKEEDSMLDRLANLNEVSRSDVMRRALRDFARFNGAEEE